MTLPLRGDDKILLVRKKARRIFYGRAMKQADYIIDVGPDGGTAGGRIVFTGTPREMAESGQTITAEYLRKAL